MYIEGVRTKLYDFFSCVLGRNKKRSKGVETIKGIEKEQTREPKGLEKIWA